MHVSLHEDMASFDAGMPEAVGEQPLLDDADLGLITLRRSGRRPISFRGVEIAHCMSFRVGTPLWYELNVFKASSGGYVADIRMFTKAEGESDHFTVETCHSLDHVADFLESYDAAKDIEVDMDFEDTSAPISEVAFQALSLRLRVESARSQYQNMVSDIFQQLSAGEGGM